MEARRERFSLGLVPATHWRYLEVPWKGLGSRAYLSAFIVRLSALWVPFGETVYSTCESTSPQATDMETVKTNILECGVREDPLGAPCVQAQTGRLADISPTSCPTCSSLSLT